MDTFKKISIYLSVLLFAVWKALGRDNVKLIEIVTRKKTNGSVRF
jgi:hypothetical protein